MNQFNFGKMLEHVAAGRKCRRAAWEVGKYVYQRTTTLQVNFLGKDSIYHGTRDFLATDWELVIETCSFGEIVEHIRNGGTARRLGWVDQSGRTFIKRYSSTSDEIWVHFPNGIREAWKGYAYETLKTDWIKCGVDGQPTSSAVKPVD